MQLPAQVHNYEVPGAGKENAGSQIPTRFAGTRKNRFSAAGCLVNANAAEILTQYAGELSRLRQGNGPVAQLVAFCFFATSVVLAVHGVEGVGAQLLSRLSAIFLLGGIGCWRWGWFVVQNVRAIIYRYVAWPRLWRAAQKAVEETGAVPELNIVAVTYKEELWITEVVFGALYRELASLTGLRRPPRIVLASGCDADDVTVRRIHEDAMKLLVPAEQNAWPPELVLIRGDAGKRDALALAMRHVAESNPHPDGVVFLMDGDSLMRPGMLNRVLPVFRLQPAVDAATTNEDGWVLGSDWFAEWISLRFGLRHRSMCSASLSGRLLCLTGRLSAFRASVAADPEFIHQVHHDRIRHWLWGEFEMLSGDDKSTWYWLAANQRRMLYVPSAMVTTIEVIKGSAIDRAMANIRRWSGNSLRHSWRAFQLGPRKLGAFCWYSLLDQRLAVFTVLVGPLICLMALCAGRMDVVAAYFIWLFGSRLLHSAISWHHGGRVSFIYPLLQVLSEWAISLTKIWILFHPAKQRWQNRGDRSLDSTVGSRLYRWRAAVAHYLYVLTCVTVVMGIGLIAGFLPFVREARLYLHITGQTPVESPRTPAPFYQIGSVTSSRRSDTIVYWNPSPATNLQRNEP